MGVVEFPTVALDGEILLEAEGTCVFLCRCPRSLFPLLAHRRAKKERKTCKMCAIRYARTCSLPSHVCVCVFWCVLGVLVA